MTKNHTKMLYGLAILLMLYHHLFCLDRLNTEYLSVLGPVLEEKLSWFCKICVAIYAFISGYGLCVSTSGKNEVKILNKFIVDYKYTLKHLLGFMKKYWIVFVIFIPMRGIVGLDYISVKTFVLSLIGLSNSYNGEWWYVEMYILLLFMFPFVNAFFTTSKNKRGLALRIITCILILITYVTMCLTIRIFVITYQSIFIIGYICAKFEIFQRIYNIKAFNKNKNLFAFLILLICIVTRVILSKSAGSSGMDVFIIAPFIFSICILFDNFEKISELLRKLGKHSVYMWLVHTFFCYNYFQPLITFSKISTIMYIELTIVSLITSMILYYIESKVDLVINYINKLVFKQKACV